MVRGEGDEGQRARSPATASAVFVPPHARSYPLHSPCLLVRTLRACSYSLRSPRACSSPPHSFIPPAYVRPLHARAYPCCRCCACLLLPLRLRSFRSDPTHPCIRAQSNPPHSHWPCIHPPILSPTPGSCVSALGFVCVRLSFV